MRIDLHPGRGCTVLEIVGNLHESKTVRANESHLILAKLRLGKSEAFVRTELEDTPDELIADLQDQLGETLFSYLTVRLTYKHSAFQNHKGSTPFPDGLNLHTSRIETEATASINRRNSASARSPPTPEGAERLAVLNPLRHLIELHLVPEKARQVLNKINDERYRPHTSIATSIGKWNAEAACTSVLADVPPASSPAPDDINHQKLLPEPEPAENVLMRSQTMNSNRAIEEVDPARIIWNQMRLTSRGGRGRVGRKSMSADHYWSVEEEITPTRAISGNMPTTICSSRKEQEYCHTVVDQERNRIMDVALRNKRSVGTETLRSIAPSVARSIVKSKVGTVSGIGLRTWGWGPPWW